MRGQKLTKKLSHDYKLHSQLFWVVFVVIGLGFFLTQSFVASPRNFPQLVWDSILPVLVAISSIWLILFPRNRNLLLLGIFYMFLTLVTFFTSFFPKPYGTFFFLFGVWLLVDYKNYKILGKSVFSELLDGNYRLALGVFVSTFIFGIITEVINLPFLIWEYHIPIPSIGGFGIPALIAAFGWTPWTLAILAIFYSFVSRKDSKLKAIFKRRVFKE